MHAVPALAVLLLLALSIPASAADQVEDGAVENGTGAGHRLDRRTKMFIHTARAREAAAGGGATTVDGAELGLFDAFFASLSMIVVSEIGDETFIIAALMAMRHPKSTVLSGALSALVVMTVLSTGLGRIVPNLISRKHTNSAATDVESSKGPTTKSHTFIPLRKPHLQAAAISQKSQDYFSPTVSSNMKKRNLSQIPMKPRQSAQVTSKWIT